MFIQTLLLKWCIYCKKFYCDVYITYFSIKKLKKKKKKIIAEVGIVLVGVEIVVVLVIV